VGRLGSLRFRNGDAVGTLAFSADGDLLASGGTDTTVVVWDLQPLRR
jgi:WD40 repeat protein